jgi:hypothetical protein
LESETARVVAVVLVPLAAGRDAVAQAGVGEVAPLAAQFVAETVSERAKRPELKVLAGLAMAALKPPKAVPTLRSNNVAITAGTHCLPCLERMASPLLDARERILFFTVDQPLCLSVREILMDPPGRPKATGAFATVALGHRPELVEHSKPRAGLGTGVRQAGRERL